MNDKIKLDKGGLKNLFSSKSTIKNDDEQPLMICQNCATEFKGNYCPHCGQSIKEFDQPFKILIYDFTGTVFAFDTKFFKTLKAILFLPGKFSTEYMAGKRARYMKPLQFYVFVSFVFFLLLNITTSKFVERSYLEAPAIDSVNIDSIVQHELNKALKPSYLKIAGLDTLKLKPRKPKEKFFSAERLNEVKEKLHEMLEEKDNSEMEIRAINNLIQMVSYPAVFISTFYKYLSWSFFIVMPMFALWLWWFYRKKRRFYWGHFIYSLEIHSATFILFSLIILIKLIFPDKTIHWENYLYWLIPINFFFGMKKYYDRSYVRTFFNIAFLFIIYSFSVSMTMVGVLLLSIFL
jgi:hypothetical protein